MQVFTLLLNNEMNILTCNFHVQVFMSDEKWNLKSCITNLYFKIHYQAIS